LVDFSLGIFRHTSVFRETFPPLTSQTAVIRSEDNGGGGGMEGKQWIVLSKKLNATFPMDKAFPGWTDFEKEKEGKNL
jgi:hypothetical protein